MYIYIYKLSDTFIHVAIQSASNVRYKFSYIFIPIMKSTHFYKSCSFIIIRQTIYILDSSMSRRKIQERKDSRSLF